VQNPDKFSDHEIVRAEPLPDQRVPVTEYLKLVMPGMGIEHLGRTDMLQLGQYGELSPSSLFFHTVHHCFQNHYPLALRPEVLMYLVLSEVATTVNMYPEVYRHLFTTSSEKVRIDVRNDDLVMGSPNSPWHEVLGTFGVELRKLIPGSLMSSFLPRFSTATYETIVASTVVLMSAVREFYDFHTHTMCGLPKIRLLGNAADYTLLREAIEGLSVPFEDHLGEYFRHLLPVVRKIEMQALGEPVDEEFWRSLYQFDSDSGADTFNGWISAFVNYIQTSPEAAYRNEPAKEGALMVKENFDWERPPSFGRGGIDIGAVPAQISWTPFIWRYYGAEHPMRFVAGILGIDDFEGFATPALSYAVGHAAS